jgi:hypothetical protein
MSAAIAEAPDKLAAATAFRSNLIYRSSWMMGQKPATKYCPCNFESFIAAHRRDAVAPQAFSAVPQIRPAPGPFVYCCDNYA